MTTTGNASENAFRDAFGTMPEPEAEAEADVRTNYQRDHGTTREPGKWTTTQREVTPLDALAAAVCLIRPDWNHTTVRSTLLRTHGSWREIATRALRVALDDDARTPYAIENGDMRRYEKSDAERHPSSRPLAEVRAELARITADTTGDRS